MWRRPHRAHARAMETSVHEIADGVYRLSTCVPDVAPGGFTFNQYLVDADECGAMNEWLAAARDARVTFNRLGCLVSVDDLADRPPVPVDDGAALEALADAYAVRLDRAVA